ncbi:MAG: sugar phosphate isomerase/epimerase [Methanobacterium sp.]|uniref:sugar phosphate isomerase/epimerase family protein n=1 Tax=Methanobacterium sp. TaxID=2164 RepID=UPI003D65FD5B|nr:sugar phosphate isomerase/epimerase [Methanobacterium sp.]
MKLGFSTLALFMSSMEQFLETASKDGFQLMEILCEGPYWPRNSLLMDKRQFEVFDLYDIDVFLHSPTIDLNPASLNPGIRDETLKQLKETVDFAAKIGANAITTHPGIIHRFEERVRNYGMQHAIETLSKANDYAEERGVIFSVENMPNKPVYFCNNAQEHQYFLKECGTHATVDTGHANTSPNPADFFKMKKIAYYHLNDNNGEKDQHLTLGEGTFDLSLLNGVDKGIIELNNYENILKSRDLLISNGLIRNIN